MGEDENKQALPLREWRLRQYWTLRKLAKRANVSTETLVRAEKGAKVWDVTARKIADALGVGVDQVQEFARLHIEEDSE
jgi:transcriptional regulator with XRE-family HTH domain